MLVMRQTWRDLTFLHWRYDPAVVRRLVPAELQLDLHDGAAWVGLVPFLITGLTYPHAPAMPWLSAFPETNVRTYVRDRQGAPGVWFFSLDAARLPAVIGARARYALPYFWARMRVVSNGASVHYTSRRLIGPRAQSDIRVEAGEPVEAASPLESFLTARLRLYAQRGGRLLHADIEHRPWPLRRARVLALKESLVRAAGLPAPASGPLTLFSRSLEVQVGPIIR